MTHELLALLQQARARHGGTETGAVRRLAKVLRLTPQRTSDALGGGRGYSLDVERCLRLALDGEHDPYDLLRKAGHLHEAELLEKLFGPWLPTAADRHVLHAVAERLAQRPEASDVSTPRPSTDAPSVSPRRRRAKRP